MCCMCGVVCEYRRRKGDKEQKEREKKEKKTLLVELFL